MGVEVLWQGAGEGDVRTGSARDARVSSGGSVRSTDGSDAAIDVAALPLAEVAHELRAPLSNIAGLARTVRDRGDVMTEEQRELFLTRIVDSAERLERLVRGVLDVPVEAPALSPFAAPSLAPVPLPGRVVALGPLVEAAVEDARGGLTVAIVAASDLEVTDDPSEVAGVRISVPDDVRVVADADALHRVVVNLVSNARKYGAPPIEITAVPLGDRVDLTVADHGAGVPDEFRQRLFAPYARADGAGGGRQGVGLGLSIVRSLVLRQHGSIRHEPNRPTGARFTVTLPSA